MRIAPAYSQPTVHVLDASRVVGVVSDLLDPDRRAALDGENRELPGPAARAARRARAQAAAAARRGAREPAPGRRSTTCRRRRSLGARVVEPDLETLRAYVDWQFFFHAWELKGRFPAILEQPGGARALRRRAGAARRDRRATARSQPAASTASGRRVPTATTSSSNGHDALLLPAASRPTTATRGRTGRLADYVAPARRPRSARSPSRHPSAPTSSPPATRPSTTTTARSWSRRSPTGSPRRSRSTCTSEARREWYAPTEHAARERRADRRALPRHPARVRLPGLPRPLREAEAVRAARRRRRSASRSPRRTRCTPAASVSGIYLAAPAGAVLLGRAGSAATRSRTTRRARAAAVAEVERWLRRTSRTSPTSRPAPTPSPSSSARSRRGTAPRRALPRPVDVNYGTQAALQPRRRGGVPAPQRRELRAQLAVRRGAGGGRRATSGSSRSCCSRWSRSRRTSRRPSARRSRTRAACAGSSRDAAAEGGTLDRLGGHAPVLALRAPGGDRAAALPRADRGDAVGRGARADLRPARPRRACGPRQEAIAVVQRAADVAAGAARALGELAVLAGARHRARLDADQDLRDRSRGAACRRRSRPSRSSSCSSSAASGRTASTTTPTSGGTCGRTRSSGRSRSDLRRRRRGSRASRRSSRSCSASSRRSPSAFEQGEPLPIQPITLVDREQVARRALRARDRPDRPRRATRSGRRARPCSRAGRAGGAGRAAARLRGGARPRRADPRARHRRRASSAAVYEETGTCSRSRSGWRADRGRALAAVSARRFRRVRAEVSAILVRVVRRLVSEALRRSATA